MRCALRLVIAGCLPGAMVTCAEAREINITAVSLRAEGAGKNSCSVSLHHADEGWAHYAER
jgi:hypothetical protein